ncbi:MAG: voltage-gated chloride channel [Candidatus Melainabacteria bacterium HGW-Melainabacteria-1]|nr:MAG: voltage-gated chloride channel [Candidatus Melainabacteria bacterium HGW-Melainabacteria-1]
MELQFAVRIEALMNEEPLNQGPQKSRTEPFWHWSQEQFGKGVMEESMLVAELFKWTLYAVVTGLLVGGATFGFLFLLELGQAQWPLAGWRIYLLPLVLLLSMALIRTFSPESAGHGTEKVIESVHQRDGRMPLKVVPVKLLATLVTLIGGGSAGKEGPCAQIGAAIASGLADLFHFINPRDRRVLVVCGISAGFAAVFGTPVAGALFAIEVLFLGRMLHRILYPAFVASMSAYYVCRHLGYKYESLHMRQVPEQTLPLLSELILFGLLCGLLAWLLVESLKFMDELFSRLPVGYLIRAGLGGVLLIGIALISPAYLGLSLPLLHGALAGQSVPVAAFGIKLLATVITLAAGGSGGILTPIFVIGACFGASYAHFFAPDLTGFFAALGMIGLLAGATNTPIASAVLAMELFGAELAPFAAAVATVSFLIVGYRSVYPSQVLAIEKSSYLLVPTGGAIGSIAHPALSPEAGKIPALLYRLQQRQRRVKTRMPDQGVEPEADKDS